MPAAKRRLLESRVDADDMSSDYALLRKVKKGKITEVTIAAVLIMMSASLFDYRRVRHGSGPIELDVRVRHAWSAINLNYQCDSPTSVIVGVADDQTERSQEDFDMATGLVEETATAGSAPAQQPRQQAQHRSKQPSKKQKKAAKRRAKAS